jgi:hypothetical protein
MADGCQSLPPEEINLKSTKNLKRKISNSAQSLNRFVRLPKPKKCRSWGRQLLRRWASTSFVGFFASPNSCGSENDVRHRPPPSPPDHVDVFASLSSDYVNFGTATPPPKPPRVVQHPWWTVADRSSPTDCEGSLTSVQSSGGLLRGEEEEEEEENRRRLLFLRFQLSAGSCIELAESPTDGVVSFSKESSGAAVIEEAESLRTSDDETHPSVVRAMDDDDECAQHHHDDDDWDNHGDLIETGIKFSSTLWSHTHQGQHHHPLSTARNDEDDFRLEDARLLWLGWRQVLKHPPRFFFFFHSDTKIPAVIKKKGRNFLFIYFHKIDEITKFICIGQGMTIESCKLFKHFESLPSSVWVTF